MTAKNEIIKALTQSRLGRLIHPPLRAWLQERKAAAGQEYYDRRGHAMGWRAPMPEDLARQVRARLATRRGDRPPGQKGALHLFLAYRIDNWEAILPRALQPFGRVTEFEWRARGFDETRSDWLSHRDAMNAAMVTAFEAASQIQPIDAVVGYLSGHNTAPEILQKMADRGAAVFNFCWDDKLDFPGQKLGGRYTSPAALAPVVDLNLTSGPASVAKYAVHGGLAMFWPEAAHPEVHRPYDIPFEYEVSFVGARYGWRPGFIRKLGQMGVKVECFGRGWPHGPLADEDMIRLYSRSRINLGFAGIGFSRKLMNLKGRDFEVPMSGGLYLTQDNPELKLVYEIGREMVTYADEQDCARKIKHLLSHPDEADAIRKAGRARALREHTYEARWSKVFSLAGLME